MNHSVCTLLPNDISNVTGEYSCIVNARNFISNSYIIYSSSKLRTICFLIFIFWTAFLFVLFFCKKNLLIAKTISRSLNKECCSITNLD